MDTTTTTGSTTDQATTKSAEAPTEQALKLTPGAVAQVKTVIQQNSFDGYYLSIRVIPAGCSGMGYDLNLIKEPKAGDVVFEQDGVKIATDAMSVQYLGGTLVDYVSSIQGAGFKFTNPNAKSTCGCGTSFSA